jgi:seryl-tRNA synthetase
MIDPNLIANNPDAVRASLRRRGANESALASIETLVELIADRRAAQTERDAQLAIRNRLSPEIGKAMKEGRTDDVARLKAEVRAASDRAAELELEVQRCSDEEAERILHLPNQVHVDTPDGADEHGNVVVRQWGTPREGGRTHDDIAVSLGMYDPERAVKVAGSRFYVLTGALAKMERALAALFCDMAEEHGYKEVLVPYIVNAESMRGTGQLPKFEDDLFKLTAEVGGQSAYLVPTAEVPVTNLHRDEILEEAQLPIRYFACTPCFRSEAGAAGRDTRGLIRVHQFQNPPG